MLCTFLFALQCIIIFLPFALSCLKCSEHFNIGLRLSSYSKLLNLSHCALHISCAFHISRHSATGIFLLCALQVCSFLGVCFLSKSLAHFWTSFPLTFSYPASHSCFPPVLFLLFYKSLGAVYIHSSLGLYLFIPSQCDIVLVILGFLFILSPESFLLCALHFSPISSIGLN